MVFFGSLLDQFVGSFDRSNGLSTFRFDAVCFIDFSARILIDGFDGLGTVILSCLEYLKVQDRVLCELCWS